MRALPSWGIPGLTPQNLAQSRRLSGTGEGPSGGGPPVDDALALEEAGAFAVLLEGMPPETAAYVRERISILTYGIGAGRHVDGQLLISHDLLGNFVGEIRPRFVKRYANVGVVIEEAMQAYAVDVREGRFPLTEHCYPSVDLLSVREHPAVA